MSMLLNAWFLYCNRFTTGETKLCSEIGKVRNYERKIAKGGIAIVLYRKAYKPYRTRICSGMMTKDEFNAWKDEVADKRQRAESGALDMEEYATWLKNMILHKQK